MSFFDVFDTRRCRACGCTDTAACVDATGRPCGWAEPDLCTSCVPAETPTPAGMTSPLASDGSRGYVAGEDDCGRDNPRRGSHPPHALPVFPFRPEDVVCRPGGLSQTGASSSASPAPGRHTHPHAAVSRGGP